jgi:hypothetical protein
MPPSCAAMTRPPSSFMPLAWANGAAQSAEQLCLAAVPMIAVMALHAGPGEVGALAGAQTLPFLLLSIPIGLLADRLSRRGLMLAAEALRAATLLACCGWCGRRRCRCRCWRCWVSWARSARWASRWRRRRCCRRWCRARRWASQQPHRAGAQPGLCRRAGAGRRDGGLGRRGCRVRGGGGAVGGRGAADGAAAGAAARAAAAAAPDARPAPGRGLRLAAPLLRPILLTAVAWNLAWFVLQAAYVPYAMQQLGMTAAGVGSTLAPTGWAWCWVRWPRSG